ncbi:TlpA family protein disulfide reductase [Desulfovibrio ferrophilus]|uniref:Putative alkyl hydroperoxide reductase n=1 Tax=Desulfovibrio ferrophilus TaxID=241368 RepID=A0A2Z6AX91_9BACT|nr:TlpA disulfide reductase family protein [Desulfovibrio ferrophilus]BBD07867.1 putative alkyl hydroperoxide reductase [Desulfovibrio ferrophilus]
MHAKRLILALALILALNMGVASASTDPLQSIGTMGTLRTIDVMRVMKQAHGKVVVLTFWASWCAPCRAEVPELKELRETFAENELLILGLNVDNDISEYAKFVTKAGFTYPVRRVDEGVQRLFKVESIPRLLIYNTKGGLVLDHEGMAPASELERVINSLLAEK